MNFVQKLSQEIARWQEQDIITATQAEQILSLYPGDKRTSNYIMIIIFSIIGALLIGGGIILILSRNWEELPQWTRSVIAFLPLLISQSTAALILYRNIPSEAWREGLGLFYAISVYVCIALISQIYQIPGSFNSFLLLCSLLVLPVCYVLQANIPMLVYLLGITIWAVDFGSHSQTPDYSILYFIALLLPALPHLWKKIKTNTYKVNSLLLVWCLVFCGFALTISKLSASHYFIVISLYFSMLYLIFINWSAVGRSWLFPCKFIGLFGQLILLLTLSYSNSYYFLDQTPFFSSLEWPQLLILVTITLFCLYLMFKNLDLHKPLLSIQNILISSVFLLVLFMQAVYSGENYYYSDINWGFYLLVNAYALGLGVLHIINGLTEGKFSTACIGTAFISCLIIIRFYDTFVDFLTRGLAFILIGALFLAANLLLSKKIKKEANSDAAHY